MEKENRIILFRIILCATLFVLQFVLHLSNLHELIYFIVLILIAGYDVLYEVLENILRMRVKSVFDEEFLMTLAVFGAFSLKEYSEAVIIMLFYQIGELFTDVAVDKSRKSVESLMELRPDTANLIKDGSICEVPSKDVKTGDTVIVRTGDRIPLDGNVLKGTSYIDTSALTGESVPCRVKSGDSVMSGCINLSSVIEISVTHEYENSTVSQILSLMESENENKTKSEKFINKFAKIYTPVVVILAAVLAFVMPAFSHYANFSQWLHRSLLFLVVSCPCALVISVPLAFFCAIGKASKSGILFKGSVCAEVLSHIDYIAFDKTGTLTKGSFTVTEVHPQNISTDELAEIAALCEYHSTHPIARAIVGFFGKDIDVSRIKNASEIAGMGMKAEIVTGNKTVVVHAGNAKLMQSINIECTQMSSCVHIAIDGIYMGYMKVSDTIKETTPQAIKSLKSHGIDIIMLTGDTDAAANDVACELDIEYMAHLMPLDKAHTIKKLQKKGTVAFAGDGINDTPAMAASDISFAMGGLGSDAANNTADAVIMDDDLQKINSAIFISKKAMRIAKENIFFSLLVKFAVMALGTFTTCGTTSYFMYIAVFADVGVSLIAVLNSLRAAK